LSTALLLTTQEKTIDFWRKTCGVKDDKHRLI
jgi:hypothetical protein